MEVLSQKTTTIKKICFFFFLFIGRTLSVLSSTQLQIDPDLPLVHDLRKWYCEEGMNIEMTDLSIQINNHENSKFSFDMICFLLTYFISFMENIWSSS